MDSEDKLPELLARIKQQWERICAGFQRPFRSLEDGRAAELPIWLRGVVWVSRLVVEVAHSYRDHRVSQRAAGLAFMTILFLIPMLVVVLGLAGAVGLSGGSESELLTFVFDNYVPIESERVEQLLFELVDAASSFFTGVLGFIVLVYIAARVFFDIEHLFNDVWGVRHRRPLLKKLRLFWLMVTIAPPLMASSIIVSTRIQLALGGVLGFTEALMSNGLPVALTTVALFVAYRLLPWCHVRLSVALISAFSTAVLIELGKLLFALYVSQVASTSWFRIFGAMFAVPLFFLWIYISWALVGAGAVLGRVLQDFEMIVRRKHVGEDVLLRGASGMTVFEILLVLAHAFERGEGSVRASDISAKIETTSETVPAFLRALVDNNIVEHVLLPDEDDDAYHLRRPPNRILLVDVARDCDVLRVSDWFPEPARDRLVTLRDDMLDVLGETTLADLIEQEEETSQEDAAGSLAEGSAEPVS